ncbi:MAG: xanthine dehydrogenase [Aestuariivita sp.]|nr:xanthine dehydrogenase [Aestuariivita sp.]
MEKFGKSQSVSRKEDIRFLTGQGRYVDDLIPEGALHMFVFRSPVAHAELKGFDLEAVREADGVHLVLGFDEIVGAGVNAGLDSTVVDNLDGSKGAAPFRPMLADKRVRFVGEAIAAIIADTPAQARDAGELIECDYDELPVHLALAPGGETIHPEAPENLAFDWGIGDVNATQTAFEQATHRIALEVLDNRIIVNSIEPRGCYAEWNDNRIHVCVNGQGVWGAKRNIAKALNLNEDQVRVTNPDVGGGFGMKAMMYPETYLCAHAAMLLSRPVHWMSERTEAMLSDNAGRDLVSNAELAFDDNYKIIAYRVNTVCNLGAYNSQFAQPIQSELFSKVLMGTYDVQTSWLNVKGVYTNTTQVDAYRGAGRPEAIYVLERVMDRAARELGIDPWDLRRRNFISPSSFPYKTATGETYDVGDFDRVLTRAEQTSDMIGFTVRKAKSAKKGKLRGQGLCYYIESILGDPSEGAKIIFKEDGTVDILVGTQSNGQGHETVFAQFLSDQTGLPVDLITVVQGDSDLIIKGGGTGGSRSATTQNNATLVAVEAMIEAFKMYLSEKFEIALGDVEFDDETFRIIGSNLSPSILECVKMARSEGRDDLLAHEARAELDAKSYPNGAHIAEVEIDPETGNITLERYSVVDDFGNLFNPMLVEGQVHGGVVQGIGQAISEQVVYDENGQLLTAPFMDYGMPRAKDIPFISFATEPVPSTANSMGVKGCGEAGTVGALAAVANAVQDALWEYGVKQVDMPFTPLRVWKMLQNSQFFDK